MATTALRSACLGLAFALPSAGLLGCGTATAVFWPQKQKSKVVTNQSRVRISTFPQRAIVVNADGSSVLGPSPLEFLPSHEVELRWKERQMIAPILGSVLATIGFTVSLTKYMIAARDDEPTGFWLTATAIGMADMFGAAGMFMTTMQNNGVERAYPKRIVRPTTLDLELRWERRSPTRVQLQVPRDTSLSIPTPSELSFEQALLDWEATSGVEPTGAELLALAEAHLAQAAMGFAKEHRARARELLSAFVASGAGNAEEKGRARSLLDSLPQAEGAQP